MSSHEQKAMSARALQEWASERPDMPEELFSDDYVIHQDPDVEGGTTPRSLHSWRELVSGYHRAFTSSTVHIWTQIEEADHVATRWEITATHTGDYVGISPTGRTATWTGVAIDRFEHGRIVESWVAWDKFTLLQSLGAVK